jgi:hypothetical protein
MTYPRAISVSYTPVFNSPAKENVKPINKPMETIERQIIDKQDEMNEMLWDALVKAEGNMPEGFLKLRDELTTLKSELSEPKKVKTIFMQARELTDEEWLKFPKEEILQLYKNCYAMLKNYNIK